MNHIPRFFVYRRKQMNSKKRRPQTPKLERQLAKKNIDYEHSTSESESPRSSIRSKSLDLPPKSFRIQGIEGEFDVICRSLGLTGPDDFGIPVEAWEARKARSQSDLLPRSRLQEEEREGLVVELSDRFKDSIRISEPAELNDSTHKSTSIASADLSDTFKNSIRVIESAEPDEFAQTITTTIAPAGSSGEGNTDATMNPFTGVEPIVYTIVSESLWGSKGGIKGVRPPLLTPPSIALPATDNTSSTRDILRSFPPESDKNLSTATVSNSDEEEDEGVARRELRPRGAAFLSESCSFTTTSNDDDSSSTTTEPMSNISPNGRFIRNISYWQRGELLGRGSFGSVYEGIADGGFFMAVKEVSLLDQGDMGRQSIYQLEQEIALLSQFEHENIVQYYGTDKDEAHLYIFLELVTKGSLRSLYQKYHLRDSQVSSYSRQILHGLKYLHERNVVHRDIKCANILVHSDGSVKLADFGLAKATKLNDVKSCKGTAFWMAPEVVRGRNQGYGLPADIWSLGCTVLEMLTQQIPYSPLECVPALFRIGKGEPPPIAGSLSRDAQDFISRCLKVDPNDRPTATQLLDHPFVRRPLPASSGSSSPYHSVGRG